MLTVYDTFKIAPLFAVARLPNDSVLLSPDKLVKKSLGSNTSPFKYVGEPDDCSITAISTN